MALTDKRSGVDYVSGTEIAVKDVYAYFEHESFDTAEVKQKFPGLTPLQITLLFDRWCFKFKIREGFVAIDKTTCFQTIMDNVFNHYLAAHPEAAEGTALDDFAQFTGVYLEDLLGTCDGTKKKFKVR